MTVPVLYLNRACDAARRAGFVAAARAAGHAPRRVAAVDGHAPGFPDRSARARLAPELAARGPVKPGMIACFLSHRLAWGRVARGAAGWALVCEDDLRLTAGPGALAALAAAAAGQGAGLVFANGRLCAGAGAGLRPLAQALAGGLGARAPGADCYLLSRAAAIGLLGLTAAQGIGCGVDWALVWNGLGDGARAALAPAVPELGRLAGLLLPPGAPLAAMVAPVPLGRLAAVPSVLRHRVRVPLPAAGG